MSPLYGRPLTRTRALACGDGMPRTSDGDEPTPPGLATTMPLPSIPMRDVINLHRPRSRVQALREMARVCRADGRIFLLEHGRSDRAWAARYQDRQAEAHAQLLGCHLNREPLDLVRQAGLGISRGDRRFLRVFHTIEARPT